MVSVYNRERVMKSGRRSQKRFSVRDCDFVKASFSKNNPKTCVMVAIKHEGVAVRDSEDPTKQTLFFSHAEWGAFIKGAKNGEFDGQ